MFTVKKEVHNCGVGRHTQQEEEMAIAGTRAPMAIWPRGVDVGVHPSGPPAEGG